VKLLQIPRPYLYAGILLFAAFGAYALNFAVVDILILLIIGVLGYFLRRYGFPVAPLVVGMILGPMGEEQLRRALQLSQGDLTTLITDTHKAESRYPHSLIAPWPEGRAVYEDRSPINHLDRLRTPMLILQGTIDKVVPPNQAVAMADAVRAAHLPVALLMLEGEGHGFRAMATRRLALEAQVSFLEQVFGLPQSPDVPVLPIENL